ncbi:unnamed protein product [Trichogramma brassicae]|uniref:MULE transposase domain-containing protein n=1 Tax=Trichogramma brassicae TaxID=86971 RepID=A0A6H5ITD0_9HYME|nr:unnamed protein product [Trichogramma brassicae]
MPAGTETRSASARSCQRGRPTRGLYRGTQESARGHKRKIIKPLRTLRNYKNIKDYDRQKHDLASEKGGTAEMYTMLREAVNYCIRDRQSELLYMRSSARHPPTPARRPRPSDRQHSSSISTSSSAAAAQQQLSSISTISATTSQSLASIEISSAEVAFKQVTARGDIQIVGLPFVYALLQNKEESSYRKVFEVVTQLARENGIRARRPATVMSDVELAMRRMKTTELQERYVSKEDSSIRAAAHHLMALAFVPP